MKEKNTDIRFHQTLIIMQNVIVLFHCPALGAGKLGGGENLPACRSGHQPFHGARIPAPPQFAGVCAGYWCSLKRKLESINT